MTTVLAPPGKPVARPSTLQGAAKRAIDIVAAVALLLLLAPLMLVIALLVVLESPGPVFYRAERVGHRGSRLRMLKFRKMRNDAVGPALTAPRDPRLTRVGRALVALRLDELPQFFHVLSGEMSLVGPRPEDPGFVARHRSEYESILEVRPGVTGWTQVAFASESTILRSDDAVGHYVESILPAKVALDLIYATRPTLARDLKIMWFTFLAVVLRRPIAVSRSTGAMTLRSRRPRHDLPYGERRAHGMRRLQLDSPDT